MTLRELAAAITPGPWTMSGSAGVYDANGRCVASLYEPRAEIDKSDHCLAISLVPDLLALTADLADEANSRMQHHLRFGSGSGACSCGTCVVDRALLVRVAALEERSET